jgi:hypothetical protein
MRRTLRPANPAPTMARDHGSGVLCVDPPQPFALPQMVGSVRAVPYWNTTPVMPVLGLKPTERPESINTTLLLMSALAPVTGAFPVAGLSLADVIPYCSPSGSAGPCKLVPGNTLLELNRPRPALEMPHPAGAPESPHKNAHSPPTTPPASVVPNITVLPEPKTAETRVSVGLPATLKNTPVSTWVGSVTSTKDVFFKVTTSVLLWSSKTADADEVPDDPIAINAEAYAGAHAKIHSKIFFILIYSSSFAFFARPWLPKGIYNSTIT